MKYSLDLLKTHIANGVQPEYLFFWGHTQKIAGITDKSCLSQWWPAQFTADGITYPTAEHWMMASKALLFGDKEQYQNILATDSPAKAKKFGRAVKDFDGEIWNAAAFQLVVDGNFYKFSQNDTLRSYLLNTGNLVIAEASPFDKIWGIGTKSHETNPANWKGTNLLGFALMEVREALKIKKWKNS